MNLPNILFLVIDCLRLDPIHGPRKTAKTEHLDALATRAVTFTEAISGATTTLPSFSSMLTGSFPPSTHVRAHVGSKLNPHLPTLAEELQRAGYFTRAEVTGPLLPLSGIDRGFDVYACRPGNRSVFSPWGEHLLDQLNTLTQPWFMLMHFFEMHAPVQVAPAMVSRQFGETRYDQSLSSLDSYIGRMLERLPEDAIVVITADHGEITPNSRIGERLVRNKLIQWLSHRVIARYAHRRVPPLFAGHGVFPVDELLRVPLFIAGPSIPEKVKVEAQVRHVDVAPTLMDLVGLPVPNSWQGRSLRPFLNGDEVADRIAYAEIGKVIFDEENWCVTVRQPPHKLYRYPYSLEHDSILEFTESGERVDIHDADAPQAVRELESALDAFLATGSADDSDVMSSAETSELKQRLRDLGYL